VYEMVTKEELEEHKDEFDEYEKIRGFSESLS
jgi:hypothetical protein